MNNIHYYDLAENAPFKFSCPYPGAQLKRIDISFGFIERSDDNNVYPVNILLNEEVIMSFYITAPHLTENFSVTFPTVIPINTLNELTMECGARNAPARGMMYF